MKTWFFFLERRNDSKNGNDIQGMDGIHETRGAPKQQLVIISGRKLCPIFAVYYSAYSEDN